MESPKVGQRPGLVDQFVVIASRADEGIFQSFNKFVYPVAPLSGSSFGHLPEFAFPDHEAVKTKQDIKMSGCYYFCLTRGPGQHQFVVCKRLYPADKGFPVCICLISSMPWFSILESLLEKIESLFFTHLTTFVNVADVIPFLDALTTCRPPESGRVSLSLPAPGLLLPIENAFSFEVPQEERLFGRPPMQQFMKPLSPNKLATVFAALLMERRIIVHSNRVDRLTHFMFGLTALLYPLEWPHPFTPILCARGLGYCAATFPFLFGIHTSLIPEVLEQSLESVTWVNLDNNSVSNPEEDIQHLKQPILSRLTSAIEVERTKQSKKSSKSNGEMLWNAFLSFWASILVPCIKNIQKSDFGADFAFRPEECVKQWDVQHHPLISHIFASQLFQQYIDERQQALRAEKAPSKSFDIAVSKLASIHSFATLQSYYDSISQHGLNVVSNVSVRSPTMSSNNPQAAPASVRPVSPPVAIFSSALSTRSSSIGGVPSASGNHATGGRSNLVSSMASSSSEESVRRTLPPKPGLRNRPIQASSSSSSSASKPDSDPTLMPYGVRRHSTNPNLSADLRRDLLMSSSYTPPSGASAASPSSVSSTDSGPNSVGSDFTASTTSRSPGDTASTASRSPGDSRDRGDSLRSSRASQLLQGRPWESRTPAMLTPGTISNNSSSISGSSASYMPPSHKVSGNLVKPDWAYIPSVGLESEAIPTGDLLSVSIDDFSTSESESLPKDRILSQGPQGGFVRGDTAHLQHW